MTNVVNLTPATNAADTLPEATAADVVAAFTRAEPAELTPELRAEIGHHHRRRTA
ncbi:hypothetical protein [Actinoplanes sp. TFC3]|uniref:hypothetical protein n=1 Tax=Actinoplanes sp. TFC3 TaxID=1710355 RepID=UPI000AFF3BB0|nr:hypothetical protein [Actinoplanes sp. TFC3]